MGPCCSKKPLKPKEHKLPTAASTVQPTLHELDNSDRHSFICRDLNTIDERCADVPTYESEYYPVPKRPAIVPYLDLAQVMPVSTPVDEEAVNARKASWTRQKSYRKLPITPQKTVENSPVKTVRTPESCIKASLSPDCKPPLAPRRERVHERRGTDFSSAADHCKTGEMLSPQSFTSGFNRPQAYSPSARSPRTRDLLTLARRQSQERSRYDNSPFSQGSYVSPSNASYAYDNSSSNISCSPKAADILNSDIGSVDGEFPRLFTANSNVDPQDSRELINTLSLQSISGRSPVKGPKHSTIKVKAKLPDGSQQLNQYHLDKQIGAGGFGIVFSAKNVETDCLYAVKVFNKRLLSRQIYPKAKVSLNELKNEIETLSSLKHKHIVEVYEVIEGTESNKVYLVLELAEHGSTFELSPMSLDDAWSYFRQLVSALHYMHEVAKYVHRDIKPHNLLINADYALKVSDFGTAQSIRHGDEFSNKAGTHAFMAPEMLGTDQPFAGKPLDMWAAGVTLFYFLQGCTPFKSRKIPVLYEQIKTEPIAIPSRLEPDLQNLLSGLINRDPVKRLTVKEVMRHPWVTRQGQCVID